MATRPRRAGLLMGMHRIVAIALTAVAAAGSAPQTVAARAACERGDASSLHAPFVR